MLIGVTAGVHFSKKTNPYTPPHNKPPVYESKRQWRMRVGKKHWKHAWKKKKATSEIQIVLKLVKQSSGIQRRVLLTFLAWHARSCSFCLPAGGWWWCDHCPQCLRETDMQNWSMGMWCSQCGLSGRYSWRWLLTLDCTCNNQIIFCDNSLKDFHQSVSFWSLLIFIYLVI